MKVGILALQGAFIEHEKIIQELGAEVVEIRQRKDLEGIDGLILPGGESTVQGKLLRQLGTVQGKLLRQLNLLKPIQQLINEGLPVLATCAGLILLAKTIDGEESAHLGTLPIVIKRNAYGRQLASFTSDIDIKPVGRYPAVFIRAPYIESVNDDVEILGVVNDHIVAVQYHNQLGLSFHPELTNDPRIHEYFLSLIKNNHHN